jgi:ketosteroid isomerase-like protein
MVMWRKDADGIWRLHHDIGTDAPAKAAAAPAKKG